MADACSNPSNAEGNYSFIERKKFFLFSPDSCKLNIKKVQIFEKIFVCNILKSEIYLWVIETSIVKLKNPEKKYTTNIWFIYLKAFSIRCMRFTQKAIKVT